MCLHRMIENTKELSLCHKLWFSNSYIFAVQCYRHFTFQTMTSVRSNNISLKYQRFTTLGSKDMGIRKTEFVARTQFLYLAALLNSFAVCCMYSYLGVVTNPSTTNLIRSTAAFFVVFCRASPIDGFLHASMSNI